jgi:hypothetical protein
MLVVVAGIAATACASPNTAGVNPSGSPAVSSGVRGIVELGPTCPVERADSPCPPKLLATSVTVNSTTTKFSVSSRSDERGHFSIPLPPGTYSVTAGANGSVQRSQVVTVTVPAGAFVSVTLMVDSGIRLPGRVTP